MRPITNVVQLRQLLAKRFPGTRIWSEQSPAKSTACWPTGLPQIDDVPELHGGLPKSAITELVSAPPTCGSALLLLALLHRTHETNQWIALVDGADSFDPAPLENEIFSRFLWVRCQGAAQALKAADLLLRDGNLPVVLLDLRMNTPIELRRVAS